MQVFEKERIAKSTALFVNRVSIFQEANFQKVMFLQLDNCSMSVKDCSALETVSISHCNKFDLIPGRLFANCPNLRWVFLSHNNSIRSLPNSILELPSQATVHLDQPGLSRHVLDSLREAAEQEGYAGPSFSYSRASRHVNSSRLLEEGFLEVTETSGIELQVENLREGENTRYLRVWLNRLGETADVGNKAFYVAVAHILNKANADRSYRENLFWPVLKKANKTCGDRIALSVLHFDIHRQILDFDKGDLAGFANLLWQGVWALSILEDIARKKIPKLKFVDPLEVYLGYPVKLKERLGLSIALDKMLYFACSALTEEDLGEAQRIVEEHLKSEEASINFLIYNQDWFNALGADVEKVKEEFSDNGDADQYFSSLTNLTKQALGQTFTCDRDAPRSGS